MSLDPQIKEAIEIAVEQAQQSSTLARRITAWMEAVVSGNEDINDKNNARRHLELIFNNTEVPKNGELI